jgi:hypothetical protein
MEKKENILDPVVDFDAVFIPDSAKAAGQIAAMFAFNDVGRLKYLGPNLWNTSDLGRRFGNYAEQIIFADGIAVDKVTLIISIKFPSTIVQHKINIFIAINLTTKSNHHSAA